MKVTPIGSRVLIEFEEAPERTTGGLYIPQTAQEKTQIGKVVAVGTDTEKEKIAVKVGDSVLYEKYAGTTISVDGKDMLLINSKDILAIVS